MSVDYVKKDGWFYRNAYPFNYKPKHVHVCVMWWRLPVFGLLRLLLSFFFWTVGVIFLCVLSWMTAGLYHILIGHKFSHEDYGSTDFIVGDRFLSRLIYIEYNHEPMKSLPTIAGKRILPWHIVAVAGIPLALWYFAPVAVSATASATHSILGGLTWAVAEFMGYSLWIPLAILAGLVLLSLVVYGVREFRKSEMYALWKMRAKARVDKWCPILPVR